MAASNRLDVSFLLTALLASMARAGEIRATVLDAAGKGLPDAVVYVSKAAEAASPAPGEPAVMDQIQNEYSPHVLPIQAGSLVRFPNKDNTRHHVYSFSKSKRFELPLYKDDPPEPVKFDVPGVVKIGCNIHDWMLGYIVVLDTPYFAKTGADGKAALTVPPGAYDVVVWSERLKGPVEATRQALKAAEAPVKAVFTPKLGAPLKTAKKVY